MIIVGITGGIAAYKAVEVIRSLVLAGQHVEVVATEAALKFVGVPTLEALSQHPVHTSLYDDVSQVRHVLLGREAKLIVIAPATAHTMAKLAAGFADDVLGNTVLASSAPILLAPAMHTEMWQNQATAANVSVLRERGMNFVGPATGPLTGADSGIGRMAEPADIVAAAMALLEQKPLRDLAGKRIVVSAGGTREPLDPVRFLGNRSSGKQGIALAEAARNRGASVTLVAAHLEKETPTGVEVIHVETTEQLRTAMHAQLAGADVILMAAAVSDFRPRNVSEKKIFRAEKAKKVSLELEKNPDILQELAKHARQGQIIVGFAAETLIKTAELISAGRKKIARKGCDYLVVNSVGWQHGFAADQNSIIMLDRSGKPVVQSSGSKKSVAESILDGVKTAMTANRETR